MRSSREGRSSALKGSSSRSRDGSAISARAMRMRARWPPEQTPYGRSASSLMSSSARSLCARSRTSASYLRHSGCTVPVCPVRTTVCPVRSCGTRCALDTRPMCARSSRTSTVPRRWPRTSTVPVVGCIRAPMRRSTLVLPAPLAPSRAQCSPERTVQSMSSRMAWPVVNLRTQAPSRAATIRPLLTDASCRMDRHRLAAHGTQTRRGPVRGRAGARRCEGTGDGRGADPFS